MEELYKNVLSDIVVEMFPYKPVVNFEADYHINQVMGKMFFFKIQEFQEFSVDKEEAKKEKKVLWYDTDYRNALRHMMKKKRNNVFEQIQRVMRRKCIKTVANISAALCTNNQGLPQQMSTPFLA